MGLENFGPAQHGIGPEHVRVFALFAAILMCAFSQSHLSLMPVASPILLRLEGLSLPTNKRAYILLSASILSYFH